MTDPLDDIQSDIQDIKSKAQEAESDINQIKRAYLLSKLLDNIYIQALLAFIAFLVIALIIYAIIT